MLTTAPDSSVAVNRCMSLVSDLLRLFERQAMHLLVQRGVCCETEAEQTDHASLQGKGMRNYLLFLRGVSGQARSTRLIC